MPAANTAFKLALGILKEQGVALEAEPLTAASRVSHHRTFSTPELHVHCQGQGRPVVLSHALGLDLHLWDSRGDAVAAPAPIGALKELADRLFPPS